MRGLRFFRMLVRLLPLDFREAHGRDMEQVFRDTYADRAGGRIRVFRFWTRTIVDVVRIAPAQHGEALLQDIRYAVRSFLRAPAFTLAAVLTVALGIGAVTAMFAVVNTVLLQPLGYHQPERVLIVWARGPASPRTWLSPPELVDIRQRVPALPHVAGLTDLEVALTGCGVPEQLHALAASACRSRRDHPAPSRSTVGARRADNVGRGADDHARDRRRDMDSGPSRLTRVTGRAAARRVTSRASRSRPSGSHLRMPAPVP